MEVRLADCAGFCFGVKRAVDTVYEQLKNGKTIYTYGPIVHNEEVVRELSEKGVRVLENKEDLKQLKAGENIPTVIIRAHGVATVELIMEFEKAFDIQIPDEDAEKIATVGDAIKYIEEHKK